MPVTDDQLELLEQYLDGELPADQEESIRQRLQAEIELAAALEALRSEHETRALVWKSCEPSDASVQRLVMKIEAAVDRQSVWAHRLANWRIPSAVAACIVVGFFTGWVLRGTSPTAGNDPGQATMVANTNMVSPANPNVIVSPNPVVPAPLPNNGLVNVGNPLAPRAGGPVDLPIVDESGNRVAVQRFRSAEEAQQFINDVTNWQKTQEKIKGGNIVPAGAQKF